MNLLLAITDLFSLALTSFLDKDIYPFTFET